MRRVVRGAIGFDGLVMSDDLSMKALSGDFTERACDFGVLHRLKTKPCERLSRVIR